MLASAGEILVALILAAVIGSLRRSDGNTPDKTIRQSPWRTIAISLTFVLILTIGSWVSQLGKPIKVNDLVRGHTYEVVTLTHSYAVLAKDTDIDNVYLTFIDQTDIVAGHVYTVTGNKLVEEPRELARSH